MQEPPARLVALLREHEQLRRKIGHKKREAERLNARIEDVGQRLAAAQPLAEACRQMDQEIHALFAALLARKRQPRGVRRLVTILYQLLQDGGALTSRDLDDEDLDDEWSDRPDFGAGPSGAGPFGAGPGPDGARARADAGGFSARRPADEPANQSLRGLFRDLATALHPDKVHDEAEKARRTEVMKEISRAYADGDLARLLDLKRLWLAGGALSTDNGDEVDRRCANLDRMNAALRAQLKDLVRKVKDLRRSPHADMFKDLRRFDDGAGADPIAALVEGARAELERARHLRDFVVSFRDGRITIDEFMRGPQPLRTGPGAAANDDDDDDNHHHQPDPDEESLDAFVEAARAPRKTNGGRRQRRKVA